MKFVVILIGILVVAAVGAVITFALFIVPVRTVVVPSPSFLPSEDRIEKTDAEWKAILTPEQYYILRQQGTERPFSSPLNNEHRKGTFVAADTGEPLFRSEQKFDSGTGWPSFWAPINENAIELREDTGLLGTRTEVVVRKTGGHLGHVFTDGPEPTGLRYCMNGDALLFIPDEVQE